MYLGAPTAAFRDPRSDEFLVNFALGNLQWTKGVDTTAAAYEKKRKRESEAKEALEKAESHVPVDPALAVAFNEEGRFLQHSSANDRGDAMDSNAQTEQVTLLPHLILLLLSLLDLLRSIIRPS